LKKIELAEEYAKKKHSNQLRKDGITTQYEHLKSVVTRLKGLGITDEDVLCAGWLHDVIEDTDTTFENINSLFGKNVALLVLALSKEKIPQKKIMESNYIHNLQISSTEAKIIKLCDISSNLNTIHHSNLSYGAKIRKIKQISKYFHVINQEFFKDPKQFPNIIRILESSSKIISQYKRPKS
jgi:guanosine-3',5'-bis(diphosphate) 3'-pyrophosphohydrolase